MQTKGQEHAEAQRLCESKVKIAQGEAKTLQKLLVDKEIEMRLALQKPSPCQLQQAACVVVTDSDEFKQVVLQRKALSKTCESLKQELEKSQV